MTNVVLVGGYRMRELWWKCVGALNISVFFGGLRDAKI
jgi:hypothetical protein